MHLEVDIAVEAVRGVAVTNVIRTTGATRPLVIDTILTMKVEEGHPRLGVCRNMVITVVTIRLQETTIPEITHREAIRLITTQHLMAEVAMVERLHTHA